MTTEINVSSSIPSSQKVRRTPPRPKHRSSRSLVEIGPYRTTGGGLIPELMLEENAEHESHLERLTIATLVLAQDIRNIKSQPFTISFKNADDALSSYTPDFKVVTGSREWIVEVKALSSLVRPSSLERYASIGRHFHREEKDFAILCDVQLLEEPRSTSVRFFFRYVTSPVRSGIFASAQAVLMNGPLPVTDLMKKGGLELIDIYVLIAHRHLCIDWDQAFSPKSRVSLPRNPFEGFNVETILRSTRFGDLLARLALGDRPTDKQQLADAAAWRRPSYALAPWCFVGPSARQPPIRDLDEEELESRAAWQRRDLAPGKATEASRPLKPREE